MVLENRDPTPGRGGYRPHRYTTRVRTAVIAAVVTPAVYTYKYLFCTSYFEKNELKLLETRVLVTAERGGALPPGAVGVIVFGTPVEYFRYERR